MEVANPLAYYARATITTVNIFIVEAPGVSSIKHLLVTIENSK
jgi:hypothetical protein